MRGDRASLDAYLKRFRMSAGEFFAAPEGLQRQRLGLDSTDVLIKPSADEAKAAVDFKAAAEAKLKEKQAADAAAAKDAPKAAAPKPAA